MWEYGKKDITRGKCVRWYRKRSKLLYNSRFYLEIKGGFYRFCFKRHQDRFTVRTKSFPCFWKLIDSVSLIRVESFIWTFLYLNRHRVRYCRFVNSISIYLGSFLLLSSIRFLWLLLSALSALALGFLLSSWWNKKVHLSTSASWWLLTKSSYIGKAEGL
jgi:hypothetical protein